MFKETYKVIGVMSGTSLDGIDLAHVHFSIVDGKWSFDIYETETVSYDNDWLNKLKTAIDFSEDKLKELNKDYLYIQADETGVDVFNVSKLNLNSIPKRFYNVPATTDFNNNERVKKEFWVLKKSYATIINL